MCDLYISSSGIFHSSQAESFMFSYIFCERNLMMRIRVRLGTMVASSQVAFDITYTFNLKLTWREIWFSSQILFAYVCASCEDSILISFW